MLAAGRTDPGPLASFTSSNKYRFKDAGQKRLGDPVTLIQLATTAEAERADLVSWSAPAFQQLQQCRDQSLGPHGFLGVALQLLLLPLLSSGIVI